MRRPPQMGCRHLRDEAAVLASVISRKKTGPRHGRKDHCRSPHDWLSAHASRYNRADHERCGGNVSKTGLSRDRPVSPQSDRWGDVHGTAIVVLTSHCRCGGFAVKFFSLTISLFLALGAFAATPKNVSYKSGDDTVQAIIYTPEG